jgi:hypothetical protein
MSIAIGIHRSRSRLFDVIDRLQASVHALYDSSPLMLAADRDIFFLPVDDRLTTHHPARIELWISRAKPIVASSIRDASTAIKWTFQSIVSFFTRTSHRMLEAYAAHPPDSDPTLASHSAHTIPTCQLHPRRPHTIQTDTPNSDKPP